MTDFYKGQGLCADLDICMAKRLTAEITRLRKIEDAAREWLEWWDDDHKNYASCLGDSLLETLRNELSVNETSEGE